MKAVLVIDMPNNCEECKITYFQGHGESSICYSGDWSKRPSWCPLKPLPEGHGDLIDRKALIENGIRKGFCNWYDEIKMADTIIEADTGETE